MTEAAIVFYLVFGQFKTGAGVIPEPYVSVETCMQAAQQAGLTKNTFYCVPARLKEKQD